MQNEITNDQLAAEYEAVFHYVRSFTREDNVAEDVTQETFLRAISDTNYQGNSSLYTYLCGIAKHVWLDYLKKHKRTDYVEPDKLITQSTGKTVEEMLLGKESAREVHIILHELKEPYKEVFSLRVFGELSLCEISKLFGKSESWARVTYHRATGMIIERLKER